MEALAQDGEQWVNYLDKYSESVQELMNLTRNKRRFYQQSIEAATLIRSSRPLCHPPRACFQTITTTKYRRS